jgi:Uma2 family endonuclease
MADPELSIRPLRRAEYDKLVLMGAFQGERIELLEGRLVHMSPIGAPHSSTVEKLTLLCVRRLGDVARVRIQSPFAALDTSEPEPDVAIVPLANYEEDHPTRADLLIEVAESSLAYDRGPKLRVYAEAGVPEYWIVNLVNRRIDVHRKPSSGRYWQVQQLDEDATVQCERYPQLEFRVGDVLPRRP